MKKNNLNTEEIFDSVYKKKVFKQKKNLLGEDVISYRIVSDKQKKQAKKKDTKLVKKSTS